MESLRQAGEESFREAIREHAAFAAKKLTRLYLGEEISREFRDKFRVDIVDPENETGHIIPSPHYDRSTKSVHISAEPENMNALASQLITPSLPEVDVMRILVGTGVARSLMVWRMLGIGLPENKRMSEHAQDILYDREDLLLDHADAFDTHHGTRLRDSVARFSEEQIGSINVVRFCVGASLKYFFDSTDVQRRWVESVHTVLVGEMVQRDEALRKAMAIFGMGEQAAFNWYDDNAPDTLIGLAFPMNPAEDMSNPIIPAAEVE